MVVNDDYYAPTEEQKISKIVGKDRNDTSLTLTSYDNVVMTDGSLTMPDGGYSPTRHSRKRPIEKRRKPRWELNKRSKSEGTQYNRGSAYRSKN